MRWCCGASKGGCAMNPEPGEDLRPLRAFTAGLGVETNTFSPLYIGLEAFEQTFLYRPGEPPPALTEVSAPLYLLRQRVQDRGCSLVEGTYAFALLAGRVWRSASESLREESLAQLSASGRVALMASSLTSDICAGCS